MTYPGQGQKRASGYSRVVSGADECELDYGTVEEREMGHQLIAAAGLPATIVFCGYMVVQLEDASPAQDGDSREAAEFEGAR
jgi:hypothetical protein